MTDIAALTALIEPEAEALGLKIVRVAMFGGTSDPTLQVMAERPDTRQLVLDDCAALSRRLSDLFNADTGNEVSLLDIGNDSEASPTGLAIKTHVLKIGRAHV